MITIKYPPAQKSRLGGWQTRLDPLFVKYIFIEDGSLAEPVLAEGLEQVAGAAMIDSYLDDLERLVAGWYEDRCDRHDFDPDAADQ